MILRERLFHHWIASWIDLSCAVISICTLGLYRPDWEMTFRCYWTDRMLKKRIARGER